MNDCVVAFVPQVVDFTADVVVSTVVRSDVNDNGVKHVVLRPTLTLLHFGRKTEVFQIDHVLNWKVSKTHE